MQEIYISVDVETDGPSPGIYSLLSIGAAAFLPSTHGREVLDTFEENLDQLPQAMTDPDTMNWWKTQPEAWLYCRENTQNPEDVILNLNSWVNQLAYKYKAHPVLVVYPVWDYMWIKWYFDYFEIKNPFGFSCIDIKSYLYCKLGKSFRKTVKSNFPKRWFEGCPEHTHKALDDAIGQGVLFANILNDPS